MTFTKSFSEQHKYSSNVSKHGFAHPSDLEAAPYTNINVSRSVHTTRRDPRAIQPPSRPRAPRDPFRPSLKSQRVNSKSSSSARHRPSRTPPRPSSRISQPAPGPQLI